MARIRTIKPEFPHSETMGRVSREARLLFVLLWTIVDDDGRARAASRMLASLLYPYDDDAGKKIDGWLTELEREDCIRRYEVDGSKYLEVCNWLKHQKIDRPSKSKIPSFDEASTKPREESRSLDADLGPVPVPVPRTVGDGESPRPDEPREKTSRKKPSLSIPEYWKPSEADIQHAKGKGLTEKEIAREAQRFVNHAQSIDRKCANWASAWGNWVSKFLELNGREEPRLDGLSHTDIWKAEAGQPEWQAWQAYYRDHQKLFPLKQMAEALEWKKPFTFPTRWPPGHKPPSQSLNSAVTKTENRAANGRGM